MSKAKITLPKDTHIPNHIVLIPDGNRRWARARGLHTLKGHKAGFDRAVELGRTCRDWGIHTVTLWGFSTENWDRTAEEIAYLMRLYHKLVDDYFAEAMENNVRIIHLGRKDRLPKSLVSKIKNAEEKTKNNTKFIMNIALDYGGADDIMRAVKHMIDDKIDSKEVDRLLFESYLDTHDQPYPYADLMIRTSGEQRTSGLLLWQAEYAEYYWERDHFPDFTPAKLKEAILDYSRRRRRFGANDKEKHLEFKPELTAKLELDWWRLSKVPEGTRFRDFIIAYLVEQYGISKKHAAAAAKYLIWALLNGDKKKWKLSAKHLRSFYRLIKDHIKLAFEPEVVASLKVKFWQNPEEDIARQLFAEEYRISDFQAAKAAHLKVLAHKERDLALETGNEIHWQRAEDYLHKHYIALKDRVA